MMNKVFLIVSFSMICVCCITNSANAQNDKINQKVIEFLRSDELRYFGEPKFKNDFLEIPVELNQKLLQTFPNNRFYIAKMESRLHFSPAEKHLVLVAQTNDEKVEGYIWELGFSGSSKGFKDLLKTSRAENKQRAEAIFRTLFEIVVYASNDAIESVAYRKEKIELKTVKGYNFKVGFNKQNKFGEIQESK